MYFRISHPADRKGAMIIYGGKELARLEKSLPDPEGDLNENEKLRKKLKDYFSVGGRVVRWPWVIFQCRGVLQFG